LSHPRSLPVFGRANHNKWTAPSFTPEQKPVVSFRLAIRKKKSGCRYFAAVAVTGMRYLPAYLVLFEFLEYLCIGTKIVWSAFCSCQPSFTHALGLAFLAAPPDFPDDIFKITLAGNIGIQSKVHHHPRHAIFR
jgi:hypothetical protein